MNPVFKFDSSDPKFNTIYAHELNRYLSEGVEWSAAPFKNAFLADMQQFGADSFAAGWLAYRSQAAQLLRNALPWLHLYAHQAETGYDLNKVNQEIKNITEFLEVNQANPWKTPYGCPKPEALKTTEEKKAEMLRQIHASPYGANLGKNWPELKQGLEFLNVNMPGYSFHVLSVDASKNVIGVQIAPPKNKGVHPWTEDWNLKHTQAGFQRGEYWLAFDTLEEAEAYTLNHLQKTGGSFAKPPADTVAETMVKDWQAEKEAADKMARMVAEVKRVTDAFLKSAKAIKIFTDESREADAKGPITDKTGFLFLRHKGVEWLFHDGCRYLCCEWDGSEWVGWQVPEEFAIKAAETQLPAYLEQYVRGFYPTK